MKLNAKNTHRLLIYFIYDKSGIVDDYIIYMLEEMDKYVDDIFVVCNGKLIPESKDKLKYYTNNILERNNVGFDVWAYKEAMEKIGWDRLEEYDEIILMNYTIMGPVWPLNEMFDTMAGRDLDYWGVTKFHQADFDPFGTVPYGYLPDHIQTHFLVIRHSLLMTEAFRRYWEEMPMINSYQESVGMHEATFTKKFADMGFKWDVYVDSEEYRGLTYQPIIGMAKEMIAEKGCPFFKRRSFMQDYTVVLSESCGQEGRKLYDYLVEHTNYDMELFWNNILRTENQADIKKTLQLNFVLPSEYSFADEKNIRAKKIALIMHIYFIDLICQCYYYAESLPENADVFITTNSEEKKEKIEKVFRKLRCNRLEVKVVPNCGRDVGPFLVESRDYIMEYDYICHVHDKKVGQLKPGSIGASFSYRCFENVLKSKAFVENVIQTFEKNPHLGLLTPPPPNHGPYYITLGMEWGLNYSVTKELAEKLGIQVSIREDKEPIAPLGSVFWARPGALKKIFDYPWNYEDFPAEPIADDGTILHGIERMYNFSAQQEGYYPGWVFCDKGAEIELTNLYHMLRTVNKELFYGLNIAGSHQQVISGLQRKSLEMRGLLRQNRIGKLYYAVEERAYRESCTLELIPWEEEGKLFWKADGLNGLGEISSLRFDPQESGGIVLRELRIAVNTEDAGTLYYDISGVEHNGIEIKGKLVYPAGDPQLQIIWEEMHLLRSVEICAYMDEQIDGETVQKIQEGLKQKAEA